MSIDPNAQNQTKPPNHLGVHGFVKQVAISRVKGRPINQLVKADGAELVAGRRRGAPVEDTTPVQVVVTHPDPFFYTKPDGSRGIANASVDAVIEVTRSDALRLEGHGRVVIPRTLGVWPTTI